MVPVRALAVLVFAASAPSAFADALRSLHRDLRRQFHSQVPFRGGKGGLLPVANPTTSLWMTENPLADEGATGVLTPSADVCIIGSGMAGMGVVHYLSELLHDSSAAADKEKVKTVVFEARDFCSGATGRNGGHLTPYSFHGFTDNQREFGTAEAVRAVDIEDHVASSVVDIINSRGWADDVNLVEGGRVTMGDESVMAQEREDYVRAVAAGVDVSSVEWIDADKMNKRYGTRHAGHWTPGNTLWPLKFIAHLFDLARTSPLLDLALHTRTPVTSVSQSANGTGWTLHTPRGTTACGLVVHATNAYASHLLPQLAITPVRGQISTLRALPNASLEAEDAFLLEHKYWLSRPSKEENDKGALVVIGAGHHAASVDDTVLEKPISDDLRDFLPYVYPGKFEEGAEAEMEWSGILGFTESGDPYVGLVEGAPGQFVLAGFSGHGMPRAFGCADVVARMVKGWLDGSRQWTVPDWIPRHYLTSTEGAVGL